jgi:serine/threonine protein kinase
VNADRIKALFAQVLEKGTAAERQAFLVEICRDQTGLRRELESLLRAHEDAGDFLGSTESMSEPDAVLEPIATVIGCYKPLEKIGEGGFGVVYLAEQLEPVRRKVALKVIKAGMDTREVIARFEAERQALALMDHPNIAKVLDGGTTEAGRPHFVMELVQGIPITEFCDANNLPTRDRLELFIKVCLAAQHAHQKGIIHRDLKPSNIMVTMLEGEPVPKVIDFGVAKALGQKLTEKTLFTSFRQMIGTPAYMSPEQAQMNGLDVDTRSDIYSLGVLLYELLSGVTPFDRGQLAEASLDGIRRIIRETQPPKPSTRLRMLGNKLTDVAKRRRTEPMALSRLVRGDLDWIVMKCLEKDRTRRYDTASALSQDLECHLNHQPVSAVAPTTVYRLSKFMGRHKRTLIGFSVAFLIGYVLLNLAVTFSLSSLRQHQTDLGPFIQARFQNVFGLHETDPVMSNGTPIGKVLRILFETEHVPAVVTVRINIRAQYWRLVHTDSKASLAFRRDLHRFVVNLDSGTTNAPVVAPGTIIATDETGTVPLSGAN